MLVLLDSRCRLADGRSLQVVLRRFGVGSSFPTLRLKAVRMDFSGVMKAVLHAPQFTLDLGTHACELRCLGSLSTCALAEVPGIEPVAHLLHLVLPNWKLPRKGGHSLHGLYRKKNSLEVAQHSPEFFRGLNASPSVFIQRH
jgi:hypothetical protein